ncbi:hypothetical protein PHLGIDRAFT_129079 [Phlebiopsis gigantea 11061_1 CR5-6]|uniref:Uncharacterized protein n=1 Tax=Phlebiopsis gigantea (strain 11061_1 CR5-6) TaxID=745531 RepID=A0A0C3S4P4_PHLG1|nr:hypothetical protein PHLGIDRAFT_129079 [Phlebiopsis gigantea 11061_1 CR5-6]
MSTPDNVHDGVPSVPSIALAPEHLGDSDLTRSNSSAVDGPIEQGDPTGSTEQLSATPQVVGANVEQDGEEEDATPTAGDGSSGTVDVTALLQTMGWESRGPPDKPSATVPIVNADASSLDNKSGKPKIRPSKG